MKSRWQPEEFEGGRTAMAWVRQAVAPPIFEDDEDKTRKASLLNVVLLTNLGTTTAFGLFVLVTYPNAGLVLAVLGVVLLLYSCSTFLMHSGHVQLASIVLSFILWATITFFTIATNGVRAPGFFTYMVGILLAGLLVGSRVGIAFAGLSALIGVGLLYAEIRDILPPPIVPVTPSFAWGVATADFIVVAVMVHLATHGLNAALERARRSENVLAENNRELAHQAEALRKANRAYKVLSDCNQAVVRATQEEKLLQDVCRILVEIGDYPLAWIGFVEQDADRTVRPVAQAGREAGDPDGADIPWRDVERGRDPVSMAVRTGKPNAARYILTDPSHEPWRAKAARRGYAAVSSLPLLADDRVFGVLSVYAAEPDAFDAEDSALLKELAGDVAYGVTALRTRAERERAEEALRRLNAELEQRVAERTAELEAANEHLRALTQLKDEFVANVSHELRTPIANIRLYHDLLQSESAKAESGKTETYLATLQRETERLARIIEDLLQLSRMDQGQVTPSPSPVDLNELVGQYVADRPLLAESRGLTLTLTQTADLPPVQGDPGLLGQALSVLLTNALNYTPSGGQVEVSTRLREADGRRWAGFSVGDTGPGIPPDEQPHLFERFYRGSVGRESGKSGTGLGLAIAREIADRHGGRIEVESTGVPGEGATFTVWLPVSAGASG